MTVATVILRALDRVRERVLSLRGSSSPKSPPARRNVASPVPVCRDLCRHSIDFAPNQHAVNVDFVDAYTGVVHGVCMR